MVKKISSSNSDDVADEGGDMDYAESVPTVDMEEEAFASGAERAAFIASGAEPEDVTMPPVSANPKKRGRPPGKTNKTTITALNIPTAQTAAAHQEAPKVLLPRLPQRLQFLLVRQMVTPVRPMVK